MQTTKENYAAMKEFLIDRGLELTDDDLGELGRISGLDDMMVTSQ